MTTPSSHLAWWHSLTGVKASQVLLTTFRKRQMWLWVLLCKQLWPHGFLQKVFRGSQGPHFEKSCSGWTHPVLTRPHLLLRQCTRISSFSLLRVRSPHSTVIPLSLRHAVICPKLPFPLQEWPLLLTFPWQPHSPKEGLHLVCKRRWGEEEEGCPYIWMRSEINTQSLINLFPN